MGATNIMDRVAAMVGQIQEVPIEFESAFDVPRAGVLFALPALLATGLLHNTHDYFKLPNGYYGLDSIFILIAFMALARVKSVEQLRYCAPGEWGNILGLDRIPEVKTLRAKLKILSEEGDLGKYSADLSTQWMSDDLKEAALFYIDGHVRVYHGSQTKLPRHHVARQRLCLRATTDYWVNAMDGQPFFYINKEVDPGLIKVVENEIIPRLEKEAPNSPTPEELEKNPLLSKFSLIFDREGYSPAMMLRLKEKHISCITYHKHPKEDWSIDEFSPLRVKLVTGEEVNMSLAERGVWLSELLWVREIRKLNDNDHQTSVISTHYLMGIKEVASSMFARWSQENFFRYIRMNFNIDALADYCLDDIPDTTQVVNPEYRDLDSQIRSLNGKLSRKLGQFGALNIESDIEPKKMALFEHKKATLLDEITVFKEDISELKANRKNTDKHIPISELPKDEKFSKLRTQTKQLIDTIKMVAYRSETAMVNILRENMARLDDARQLASSIYKSEADLIPDYKNKSLTVRLHTLANYCNDLAIETLCHELNETQTLFPGTDLRMIFKFGIT